MQDDSYNGRDEALMQMREMARRNEDNMRGHAYRAGTGQVQFSGHGEGRPADSRGGTFGLRLVLCLMIWGGFFWMHMENAPILGYQTEKVAEAVSTDVGLQDLTNSVKMKP